MNILKVSLSSSDSEDEKSKTLVASKHSLKVDFKEKFEKLKAKRKKLAQKSFKKEERRRVCESISKIEKAPTDKILNENDDQMKKHVINYNTRIKDLDWNQLDDDIRVENEKKSLQNDLEHAIKTSNIELADELNEKLIDCDSLKNINYAVGAYKYENEAKCSSNNKKKKLKWQFEAKERWQSKSNM